MAASSQADPAGIYMHIPFCVQKCPYCDFYSVTDHSLKQPLVASLLKEIQMRGSRSLCADTLYMGGGTPSTLNPAQLSTLLHAARQRFTMLPDAEITVEVNPGTVDRKALEAYRRTGINRISIGVQSFLPSHLHFLERVHTSGQAVQAITSARDAGFDNIGLDLIYGIPGQTVEAWRQDLEKALEFEPEHLSCYMLTFEAGTPMDDRRKKGAVHPVSDKEMEKLFDMTRVFLEARGYLQYEVSSYARSDKYRSRHNQKYWSSTPYIGLGPSAHSLAGNRRSWNHRAIKQYIHRLNSGMHPTESEEILTREQQMIEFVYLGLRQVSGIDLDLFHDTYSQNFHGLFKDTISLLQKEACLTVSPTHCFLTPKGMRFLDSIVSMFVNHEFPGSG